MSAIVKAGKKLKNLIKNSGLFTPEHRVTYVRRIERIKTDKRVCAMTFDDGPMTLPTAPDGFGGRGLTDVLLDILKRHNARATFDIVGCTAENYPDTAGKIGSAAWGGEKYDHYPDINSDAHGGAVNCPETVQRMLDEGHELANHGYRHIIFGKKPFVYGKRKHFNTIDEVTDDLSKLHSYVKDKFDYEIKLSRPPHYVDRIDKRFTSFDAYALMNYGYMAASYDGGGWLPSGLSDTEAATKDEIDAMIRVIENKLLENPDFFCGQIIFGKDGYNMAKRTPVAYALDKQLDLLERYGYTVVPVSELMEESPFADIGRECDILPELIDLSKNHAIAYSDNTLRLENKMTNYEYSMLVCPREIAVYKRIANVKSGGKYISEYDTALDYAKDKGFVDKNARGKDLFDGRTRYEVLKQYINENTVVTK